MTPIPFFGPESSLRPISFAPVPNTRQRLLTVDGPPGFRIEASIGPRSATIVQHVHQLTNAGILPTPHKVGTVSLIRPLPKGADADVALALVQESLAHGLHQVDQLLDAVERTLKALARPADWMFHNNRPIQFYLQVRAKGHMNLGGSIISDIPRTRGFALDRIFAGKICITKGQIRPVRWASTQMLPADIPTSHHARLPLLADALRAWSALGHDAADWLSKANDLAEKNQR